MRLLLEKDFPVTVIDSSPAERRCNLTPIPDALLIDNHLGFMSPVKENVGDGIVFHPPASVDDVRSIERLVEDAEVSVVGTLQELEAARRHTVRMVVFSISARSFGELGTLSIRVHQRLMRGLS